MALAVGSSDFGTVGIIELGILKRHGLQAGHSVIDLGCGSGRLAKQLGLAFPKLRYHGIDVVPELLSYAATKSPQHFRFSLNENIAIPSPDDSVDFVTAFSVFTHLFHEESYCYLLDAKRAIKPGGKIIFSFLESSNHWPTFEHVLSVIGHRGPLTMFMERSQIEVWAEHLGLNLVFGDSCDLGQSVAVLSKPAIVI